MICKLDKKKAFKNGSIYEGQFNGKSPRPNGHGIMFYDKESALEKYEGEWENGLKHGSGVNFINILSSHFFVRKCFEN